MAKRNKKKNKKKTKLTPEEVIRRKAESEKRQNATNPFSKVRGDKNHEKRKALIKEDIVHTLRYKSKAGAFNDKRISTNNAAMSQDEKMEQRFLANRRGKSSKYNPEDSDEEREEHILKFREGRSLAEIDRGDDGNDSDSDDDGGKIGAEMTRNEFFAGGEDDNNADDKSNNQSGKPKTWEQKLGEQILKTRKDRDLRDKQKDLQLEAVEESNAKFDDFRKILTQSNRSKQRETKPKAADDVEEFMDFTKIAAELAMMPRAAQATDRIKTAEEEEKEEKEKQEKDEEDKRRRMQGITEAEEKKKKNLFRSPDELDYDDFEKQPDWMTDGIRKDADNDLDLQESSEEEEEEEGSDEEEDDEDDDSEEEEEGSEMADDDEDGTEEYRMPTSYEELCEMLKEQEAEGVSDIITNIRKQHHPSKAEGNKQKQEALFGLLLQYYMDCAGERLPRVAVSEALIPHLQQLCQMSCNPCATHVQAAIFEAHDAFMKDVNSRRKRVGRAVKLDTIYLLKLVKLLFSTSDLKHPIVEPANLFMANLLNESAMVNQRFITANLMICTILYDYNTYAKRFIPDVPRFLHGVLYNAIKKEKVEWMRKPFNGPLSFKVNLLRLREDMSKQPVEPLNLTHAFNLDNDAYVMRLEYRVTLMLLCLNLLNKFSLWWCQEAGFVHAYTPCQQMWKRINLDLYPPSIKALIDELNERVDTARNTPREALWIKPPIKMIKMYEPAYNDPTDPKKRALSREEKTAKQKKKQAQKDKKAYKKEIRELKRHREAVAEEKERMRHEDRAKNKRKFKEMLGDIANQAGEFKEIKKRKYFPHV